MCLHYGQTLNSVPFVYLLRLGGKNSSSRLPIVLDVTVSRCAPAGGRAPVLGTAVPLGG
jgi:hypothetical protein